MSEKQANYKVGSDNDNPESVRTRLMGEAASFIAGIWKRHIYPQPYERSFNVDGIKVRVQVGEEEETLRERFEKEMGIE